MFTANLLTPYDVPMINYTNLTNPFPTIAIFAALANGLRGLWQPPPGSREMLYMECQLECWWVQVLLPTRLGKWDCNQKCCV